MRRLQKRRTDKTYAWLACLLFLLLANAALVSADVKDRGAASEGSALEPAAEAVRDEKNTAAKAEISEGGQTEDEDAGTGTATGTAVLVGAGAYTYMRLKWKEKKGEQKYEYFENHTKNGTLRKEERDSIT